MAWPTDKVAACPVTGSLVDCCKDIDPIEVVNDTPETSTGNLGSGTTWPMLVVAALPVTLILANPVWEVEPIAVSNWSSEAKTVISWSIYPLVVQFGFLNLTALHLS